MFGDGGGGYDDETNDLGLLLFWRLEADLTHTPLIFELNRSYFKTTR